VLPCEGFLSAQHKLGPNVGMGKVAVQDGKSRRASKPGDPPLAAIEHLGNHRVSGRSYELLLVLVCALFSTSGLVIKLLSDTNPFSKAGFRSGIAALALWLLFRKSFARISRQVLLTAVPYAATLICFVCSTHYTAPSTAIFLQSTAPLYVLLLSITVRKYSLTRSDISIMAIFALGIVMFFLGSPAPSEVSHHPRLGDFLGALSGVFQGITIFMYGTLPPSDSNHRPSLTAIVLGNLLTFLVCLPVALYHIPTARTPWIGIAYLGLFQIALGFFFFSKCVEHISPLQVSLILLLEPILNSVWVGLVLHDWPKIVGKLGGLLILCACGWDLFRGSKSSPAAPNLNEVEAA
jgi:drug/metabolite transporter, DME family